MAITAIMGRTPINHCLGGEQLREDLQLALFLQWLSCRAPFPAESTLDQNGSVPPASRRTAKRRRRPRDRACAHAWVPRSQRAEARKICPRDDRGDFIDRGDPPQLRKYW